MHEFTLAFVGSINIFILHHYSERMAPEQILGAWGSRILRPQTSQNVGCRPCCWSSPLSLMTMAALVRHIRFYRTSIVFSSRTVGYGGWSWCQKTPWSTTPWESRLPSELPASVSKSPKWILSFSLFV